MTDRVINQGKIIWGGGNKFGEAQVGFRCVLVSKIHTVHVVAKEARHDIHLATAARS